jgi:aryl-alcohol dehydrogenase-like predicted oxidoreductase
MARAGWLTPSELRIGLGCMRMSTDEERDERLAHETIAAAAEAGVTVFDTARAYGLGERELGHNERLLSRALKRCGAEKAARIVTKGGMTRPGGAWVPDGRAKAIRADCEASLDALDGLPINLYLIHAPDPRTPWRTSVRALARLANEGLVKSVGLSNVNRPQLDEALELAEITAVEVALSVYDERALRGGVVERCAELGIAVIAHSPLGGPRRARGIARQETLGKIADARGVTAAEVALAWLLGLSPAVVPIPGARRPETARSAARAADLHLDDDERKALGSTPPGRPPARRKQGEVLVVMGIPGAGKARVAGDHVARGYTRLNRDERGGSLRQLADALEEELASGALRVVLDNTYLTRASRSYVIEAADRHGLPTRCVWLDTPLAQAQINMVARLLDLHGALPSPEELRELARREPGMLTPTSQMRAQRELEPPSPDEGWATIEHVPFERTASERSGGAGVFVAAAALTQPAWKEHGRGDLPHLVYDWSPGGTVEALDPAVADLRETVSAPVEAALCPHPAGPPTCWCRPPLPGLPLAFARKHGIDPSRSTLLGTGPAHKTLAGALGATYVDLRIERDRPSP